MTTVRRRGPAADTSAGGVRGAKRPQVCAKPAQPLCYNLQNAAAA